MNRLLTTHFMIDSPVPYKNILLHPIKVKDYLNFMSYIGVFLLDKNSIPDVKIISMTELEYLYHLTEENSEQGLYLYLFDKLLELCTQEEEFKKDASLKRYVLTDKGVPVFLIKGEEFTSNDFVEMKKIICEQNLVELPDENISKEVRDSLEKAQRYKQKHANRKNASFEDYIVSIAMVTGWSHEYIYEMSVRKFIKTIERFDNMMHYKIYLQASLSGMVEFKDKSFIKHWLSDIESSKYSDVSVDYEELQNKISLKSAK